MGKVTLLFSLFFLFCSNYSAYAEINIDHVTNEMMKKIHPNKEVVFDIAIFKCSKNNDVDVACTIENGRDLTKARVYIADVKEDNSLPPKTIIYFLSPKKMKGRVIFHDNQRIWMYFPKTSQSIRIPKEQNVLGDIDIGALLDIDYRFGYEAKLLEKNSQFFSIEYTKNNKEKTHMEISRKDKLPFSATFFSRSGKKIRTASYLDIGPIGTRESYRRINFQSFLKKNKDYDYTTVLYEGERDYKLPSILLNPNQLKNFQKRVRP